MENIGRFELRGKLGEGSMAVVYKAYDPSIDRTLAIKLLKEDRCSDPEYRMRFLREAKAAGILSHANIATVYDVGEVGSRPYIAMEFLEGKPLDEVMKSGEKMEVRWVVTLGIQLARALDYAHSKGIVHRDVKPGNIVCLPDGETIKVTDFGIAHIENKEATRQTQMGEILGTPQYMSPEQVMGEPVDPRSDLFSVGVILYQLLTGQKPFEADTLATLLFRIATEDPPAVESAAPDVPPSLRRLVEKLLQKKPLRRFQSGQELRDALIKVLRELEESSRDQDLPRIIPLRIKWTAIMAGLVAVTMLVCMVVVYNRQHQAMMEQVREYGSSLVKFMATESSVPILSEDWTSIELFATDVMERQRFHALQIIDHQGIVRGSNDLEEVGAPFTPTGDATELYDEGGVRVTRYEAADGSRILDFATAVLFQNRQIGRVHLGIPEEPLLQVSKSTMYMLIVLLAVTLGAVAVGTYLLASLLTTPLNSLRTAFEEIETGNVEYQITIERSDELGRLFVAFNRMAQAVAKRHYGEVEGQEEAKQA